MITLHHSPRTCLVDKNIRLNESQRLRLHQRYNVIKGFDSHHSPQDVKGLIIHSKVSASFVQQFPSLEWIAVRANNSSSYLPPSLKTKIIKIPSLAGVAVAEHVFSLILNLTKQISLSHQNVCSNRWKEGLKPNIELFNKKLGIIGYGTIGQKVAEIAKAFQMQVLIANSSTKKEGFLDVDDVIKNSDILTLHISTRPENIHFMNEFRLRSMPKNAILINTSRGEIVDEVALIKALKDGHLGGAGLDVFEKEPLQNSELFTLPSVTLTPHVGYETEETLELMTNVLISNILQETNK